ncbi:hypothetical protein Mgra_00005655 [Meloidogyne graminicola]|uniref:Transmembrane protein n=1 Tax=Meloidogyne graminicola TaxID=189291 RepID=A0A8S9ZNY5_9BILA|nr:hypothetical protein Mgra_00005655 [Meloidogyne graminicola]
MKTILPSDIWISDLLFLRQNRSLLYTENGETLIIINPLKGNHFLCNLFGWLFVHLIAIILNFLSQFIICNLAICNIFLSLGLFIYTFLIDFYYNVDSFDTLILINGGNDSLKLSGVVAEIWTIAKVLFQTVLVEQFFTVQQIIILFASIYGYCTVFCTVVPYLVTFLLLDKYMLQWICFSKNAANVIRLFCFSFYVCFKISSLLLLILFSLLFSASSLFFIFQQRLNIQQNFGNIYFNDIFSFIFLFLLIICFDFIAKIGIFIELLNATFSLKIVADTENFTLKIEEFFAKLFKLSHFLLQFSPLIQSLFCLFGNSFYRCQIYIVLQKLSFFKQIFCQNFTLDYSSETLQSILAEQTKQRQMNQRRGRKLIYFLY